MKQRLQIFFLSLLLSPVTMLAQNKPCTHSISGKVLDAETKAPLPSVTVKVSDSDKYVLTNQEGEFFIDELCSEINTLIVSCLGYSESTHEHHHDHESDQHILLTPKVVGLEEVTIEAERAKEKGTETISQVTVTKAEIKSDPTQSLAASLSSIQGVTFASKGTNVQLPVIHGLLGNRILVLNNGLKHGFQNWGNDHAPEIDITSASNITVVKGAAGVRYGPEALGGAIIVEPTKLLLNNPLYLDVGTGYQTNGRGYNTNLELGHGTDKWSYFINGNYTRIGDRRAANFNLTNSGKEEKAFSLGLLRHIKNWDFKIHYSFIDQNLAILRTSFATSPIAFIESINSDIPVIVEPFSYNINEPNQEVQHHLAKGEINWWYSNKGKLTLRGGIQINKREEFDVRRNADLPIIDLDLITNDYQLEWKHPEWNGLNGLIGVQYFSQNNDNNPGTNTTAFIPNYNTDRYSAFVTESLKSGRNTFEGGIRIDIENNDIRGRETNQDIFRDNYSFTNVTGSLGYIRRFSENTTFRTNIGTAWRTPNVAELFSFGQEGFRNVFGLLRFSDDDNQLSTDDVVLFDESSVEPERGYKFINELQTGKNGNLHNLTFYSHYIDNYIYDRPIGVFGGVRGPNPAFIYDQADAFFIGFDYNWKKEWTSKLSGNFGLSYLWSRNIGENQPLINQPPISTSYEFQWNHGNFWIFENSRLTIKPSYTFRQFQAPRTILPEDLVDGSVIITPNSEIFDFEDAPEGYFLLDIAWNFKWNNISAGISARNLLNTSFVNYLNELRYFADDPGRNILFTLNYSFKTRKQ